MKATPVTLLTTLTAIALLAGCTPATPEAGGSTPPTSAPAPTVTVTVTATPEPPEPVSEETPVPPVMSSAEAIEQCLDYQSTVGTGSKATGTPYAFLTRRGTWLVVVDGTSERGPLYISCDVGGEPAVAYGESVVDAVTPMWFNDTINRGGGL